MDADTSIKLMAAWREDLLKSEFGAMAITDSSLDFLTPGRLRTLLDAGVGYGRIAEMYGITTERVMRMEAKS